MKKTIVLSLTIICSVGLHHALAADAIKKADLAAAHVAVKRILKDPESARFTDEFAKPDVVCGLVNGKNSYGGYVGARRYVFEIKINQATILDPDSSLFTATFDRICGP